jgi:TolB-like protein/class 3 adenylate cyclase
VPTSENDPLQTFGLARKLAAVLLYLAEPAAQGCPLATEHVQRRLAAILAADVAGYSRLMGMDEESTLARLKEIRANFVDPTITSHRGRIVKTTGDGILAEFASAVDAARGAAEIQRIMEKQNISVPQDMRIEFRIGMHVGDIIIDDDDIFGDGVNIAARLEGLATPGGVCISDDAQRQIRGKIGLVFDDLGPQSLKNIAEPMRVWQLQIHAGAALAHKITAVEAAQPPALPDKPSIAVLPFQNMSGDPEQEYFADGMVEDITTALSRFRSLFVIARNSSFTYKGKAVDIRQVGRELGVRYLLEGSVRRAGGQVRISGQLIDVTTGAHLWADRFDGEIENIFDLQDKVTRQVIGAITSEINQAETDRAIRKPSNSIDAVTECYRGISHAQWPTGPENNDRALIHFKNAWELDPTYALAYGGAAMCLMWRRVNKWPRDNVEDTKQLSYLAECVKKLRSDDAYTLSALGFALVVYDVENYEVGIDMVETAIGANPNLGSAYLARGFLRVWDGGSDNAISDFEQSMRFSPRDPFSFTSMIGLAFGNYNAGKFTEAANWADKAIRTFPFFIPGLQIAIMCYVGAGRIAEARRVKADSLRMIPALNSSAMEELDGLRSPEIRMKMREAHIKAALPE